VQTTAAAAQSERLYSPELSLLLSAIRAAIEPASRPPRPSLLAEIGWISFLKLALEHHVAGLAFAGLSRHPGLYAPSPVVMQLGTHARHILQQRADELEELRRIGSAFARAGIETIPIKGPALRRRLFPNLAAGPSRDLDFLIRPRDTSRVLEILAECGYRADSGLSARQSLALMDLKGQEILKRDDGRFAVEPHIGLTPSNLGLKIDLAGLWQRSRPGLLDGVPIRVLEAEDEFLLLAVHGSKEGWARLKWLIDLAAFIRHQPQLDWLLVSRRAESQGVRRMVGLSALLLADILGTEIRALAPARRDRSLHALARTIVESWKDPIESRVFAKSIFELCWTRRLLCDNARAQVSYGFRTAVTPREIHYRLIRLPDSMLWMYHPIKMVHDYVLWPGWMALKWLMPSLRRTTKALESHGSGATSRP
jgi:hypothetical protein